MGRLGGNSTTTFMIALGNKFRTAVLIRRGRKYLSYMLHLLYCYAQRFSHHIFLPFTLVVFGYVFSTYECNKMTKKYSMHSSINSQLCIEMRKEREERERERENFDDNREVNYPT